MVPTGNIKIILLLSSTSFPLLLSIENVGVVSSSASPEDLALSEAVRPPLSQPGEGAGEHSLQTAPWVISFPKMLTKVHYSYYVFCYLISLIHSLAN